ncbi:MAG: cation:proton antiporter [Synergistaceae bacterium]|jgi:multicomponent Na+:H+ antiporter subunit F|nr:cation:proton antiporter [Synergistaceae bacterium]
MSAIQYLFGGTAFIMAFLGVFLVGRLWIGPTTPDRLVVLDTINTFVSGIMLLLGAFYDSVVMVDVAIIYMALSFVGTLYFARWMEGDVE